MANFRFKSRAVPLFLNGQSERLLPLCVRRHDLHVTGLLQRGRRLLVELARQPSGARLKTEVSVGRLLLKLLRYLSHVRKNVVGGNHLQRLLLVGRNPAYEHAKDLPLWLTLLSIYYLDLVCADLESDRVTFDTGISLQYAAEALLLSEVGATSRAETYYKGGENTRIARIRTEIVKRESAVQSAQIEAQSQRAEKIALAGAQGKKDKFAKDVTPKIIEIYLNTPGADKFSPLAAARKIHADVLIACANDFTGKRKGKSPALKTVRQYIEKYRSAK